MLSLPQNPNSEPDSAARAANTYSYAELVALLPEAKPDPANWNRINFKCPLPKCEEPEKAYVLINKQREIHTYCAGCFRGVTIGNVLGLTGKRFVAGPPREVLEQHRRMLTEAFVQAAGGGSFSEATPSREPASHEPAPQPPQPDQSQSPNSMGQWADWYACNGFAVLPLHYSIPNGDGTYRCSCGQDCGNNKAKHPQHDWSDLTNGVTNATAALPQVAVWWGRWPDANIGLAIRKGVLVLDVDPRKGGDETLAQLCAQHGELPRTPTVKSGSGGYHYWFALPKGVEVKSSRDKVGRGLDVKAFGNYAVGPPSRHISGNRYEWVVSLDEPMALVPQWLLELAEKKAPATNGGFKKGFQAADHPLVDGERRHHYLFALGLSCKGRGLSDGVTRATMAAANAELGEPLDEKRFERTFQDLLRRVAEPDFVIKRASFVVDNGGTQAEPPNDDIPPPGEADGPPSEPEPDEKGIAIPTSS